MTRPQVVLLPGLLCDQAVWSAQQQALDFADCLVPSYGKLSSITEMAQSVLEQTTSEKFSLAGHSMGGRVALEIVRLAPERVERLALLDTGIDPIADGDAGLRERSIRMELLRTAQLHGMRYMGKDWAPAMVHPDRVGTPLFEDILDMIERQNPKIFEAQINALLSRPNARPVLADIQCPLLMMCGRQDTWSPLTRHRVMQALCPGSQLVVIEDSGHMTTMEQPHAVSKALIDWMHDHGSH